MKQIFSAQIMNKSVEDLVEKVREYAEDPSVDDKPRRPLTGYYADPQDIEAASRVRPLHVSVNERGHVLKENLEERNSLPRVNKTRGNNDAMAEKSRSMEDLSSASSREVLSEVQQYIF
jgi:hypothetical protein